MLDELLNPLHIHARLLPANHLLVEEEEERDCAAKDIRPLYQPIARREHGNPIAEPRSDQIDDERHRRHRADEGHIHHPREPGEERRADRRKQRDRTELRNLLHHEQKYRTEQHADQRGAECVHRGREQHGERADAQHEHAVQCREYTDQDKVADFPGIHRVPPVLSNPLTKQPL